MDNVIGRIDRQMKITDDLGGFEVNDLDFVKFFAAEGSVCYSCELFERVLFTLVGLVTMRKIVLRYWRESINIII